MDDIEGGAAEARGAVGGAGEAQPERLAAPFLRYRDASGTERVFELQPGHQATIGRGQYADLQVWWDGSVSLVHAEVTQLGERWLISDDGVSRNGTFVNGERLRMRRRLRDGDAIRVGSTTLTFNQPIRVRRDATTISDIPSATTTVTLLFTDLVGSTELMGRLGEDASHRLRREHFAILRAAASEHGGREVKSLGDGLMLVFASALQAVRGAVLMQRRTSSYGEQRGVDGGLRVGLNAGEVIDTEDDYFGAPVVVAKRLCDRATSGQILASETVRALAGERAVDLFTPLGRLRLKGLSDPVTAFEVAWR
jgi:class 3 adenylate cyclase